MQAPSGDSASSDEHGEFVERLKRIVGAEYVAESDKSRRIASQDVYRSGELPLAVVSPASTEEVSSVVRETTAAGIAVFVRGGGMSYTDAFLPDRSASIILSTDRLTAIREINSQDLYVTVESGCTWAELDRALEQEGVRGVFWGPMSGSVSTVGGAMAQGAVTFGSSRNGSSMAAAIGLEVVLADGRVLVTGSAAQPNHSAFYREYGPDMTGLFCGDSGALGVKTAVTIRLQPRPGAGAGLSFSFDSFAALTAAVGRVSRYDLATETFGAETALVRAVAGDANLRNDFKQLLIIMRGAPNWLAAIRNGLRAAIGGRSFLRGSKFLANFLAEGYDAADLKKTLSRIREQVGNDGVEIANTMAEFTRAMPFPEPAVLGPGGKRLLPLHGVVPYSKADDLHTDYCHFLDSIRSDCDRLNVSAYVVFATCGSAGFLYEIVIYWEDEWLDLHRDTLSEETLAQMQEQAANSDAAELVERIRLETIEIMYRHGATHFQIGRAYPYARQRNAASLSVLRKLKREVDPNDLLNPGALGLLESE